MEESNECAESDNDLRIVALMRSAAILGWCALNVVLLLVVVADAQPSSELQKYFQGVGLSQQQIDSVRAGQPVATALPSRTPDEVFLFGAVYVHAAPTSARDLYW